MREEFSREVRCLLPKFCMYTGISNVPLEDHHILAGVDSSGSILNCIRIQKRLHDNIKGIHSRENEDKFLSTTFKYVIGRKIKLKEKDLLFITKNYERYKTLFPLWFNDD